MRYIVITMNKIKYTIQARKTKKDGWRDLLIPPLGTYEDRDIAFGALNRYRSAGDGIEHRLVKREDEEVSP